MTINSESGTQVRNCGVRGVTDAMNGSDMRLMATGDGDALDYYKDMEVQITVAIEMVEALGVPHATRFLNMALVALYAHCQDSFWCAMTPSEIAKHGFTLETWKELQSTKGKIAAELKAIEKGIDETRIKFDPVNSSRVSESEFAKVLMRTKYFRKLRESADD